MENKEKMPEWDLSEYYNGVDDPKIGSRAEQPLRREGYRSGGWTLLDFGCVVVHIFSEEMRSFYSLDRLWSDAEKIDYKDFL